jgi:hypothetical protein
MKIVWATGLMIVTVLAGSVSAGERAKLSVGWDPIPAAEAKDGPCSSNRFWTDSTGQRWDMGYIDYKPEYEEIAPGWPGTPRDRIVEISGKAL